MQHGLISRSGFEATLQSRPWGIMFRRWKFTKMALASASHLKSRIFWYFNFWYANWCTLISLSIAFFVDLHGNKNNQHTINLLMQNIHGESHCKYQKHVSHVVFVFNKFHHLKLIIEFKEGKIFYTPVWMNKLCCE